MAKQTAVTIKAQAAAIATALNTIFDDTGAPGSMEASWKDGRQPLRDILNLVTLSDAGQFAANDTFIDAAYSGEWPMSNSSDLFKNI